MQQNAAREHKAEGKWTTTVSVIGQHQQTINNYRAIEDNGL